MIKADSPNNPYSSNRRSILLCTLAVVCLLGLAAGWALLRPHYATPKSLVYSPAGFGGFVSKTPETAHPTNSQAAGSRSGLVSSMLDDYRLQRYSAAEVTAQTLVKEEGNKNAPAANKQTAQAMQVLAYSAARQRDFKAASERFAALQAYASHLPDKRARPSMDGQPLPTLEQDAAFQQAVCVSALGQKRLAEALFLSFIRTYPDSPLIQAAAGRVATLHGGNFPTADMPIWKTAEKRAVKAQQATLLAQAMCGPECFAELLRREGRPMTVSNLASRLHTSTFGTSLADMDQVADDLHMQPEGVALTPRGLTEQTLPAIALLGTGHYVLVDSADLKRGVTIWDPDAHGVGHGGSRALTWTQWNHAWHGIALVFKKQPEMANTNLSDGQIDSSRDGRVQ